MTDSWDDDEVEGAGGVGGLMPYEEVLGHTLLCRITEIIPEMSTIHGDATDLPRADVVDLDTGEEYEDVLLFGKRISGQLRRKLGKQVCGKLGQGEKEKGKNAPWQLEPMTEEDEAKVRAWKAKRVSGVSKSASSGVPF